MKVVCKVLKRERKCPSCNWTVFALYALKGRAPLEWLCGCCLIDRIVGQDMEVVATRPQEKWFLLKWIEERSLTLPDENDAKHALYAILGEVEA